MEILIEIQCFCQLNEQVYFYRLNDDRDLTFDLLAGRVLFAEIKTENGKSRGCGSVRFETPDQADAAVRHLNGMEIDGRRIVVHIDSMK